MSIFLSVAIGGALGALARYKIFDIAQRYVGGFFPWGTCVVNAVGSFAFGLLWVFFDRLTIPTPLKMFVFLGFLGSFTTFSHYTFEAMQLFRLGKIGMAMASVLANNILSFVLVCWGFAASRRLLGIGA